MRRLSAFAFAILFSSPLLAMHCPMDMAKIDELLKTNPPKDAATLQQVSSCIRPASTPIRYAYWDERCTCWVRNPDQRTRRTPTSSQNSRPSTGKRAIPIAQSAFAPTLRSLLNTLMIASKFSAMSATAAAIAR